MLNSEVKFYVLFYILFLGKKSFKTIIVKSNTLLKLVILFFYIGDPTAQLSLSNNLLSGQIPSEIGNLTKLRT